MIEYFVNFPTDKFGFEWNSVHRLVIQFNQMTKINHLLTFFSQLIVISSCRKPGITKYWFETTKAMGSQNYLIVWRLFITTLEHPLQTRSSSCKPLRLFSNPFHKSIHCYQVPLRQSPEWYNTKYPCLCFIKNYFNAAVCNFQQTVHWFMQSIFMF